MFPFFQHYLSDLPSHHPDPQRNKNTTSFTVTRLVTKHILIASNILPRETTREIKTKQKVSGTEGQNSVQMAVEQCVSHCSPWDINQSRTALAQPLLWGSIRWLRKSPYLGWVPNQMIPFLNPGLLLLLTVACNSQFLSSFFFFVVKKKNVFPEIKFPYLPSHSLKMDDSVVTVYSQSCAVITIT